MKRKERIIIIDTILFQKYHVLSLLGSGSSSSVYLVEHLKMKQYRAVKCIPKALATEASVYQEASLLKNLRHPGIPIVYDVEEDEQNVYLIEEYVEGESLAVLGENHNNISQETVISYGIQLCDIVEYLHSQQPNPVLYLDFKPEHVLVCGEKLKLIDFGIATSSAGTQSRFYGTRGFAAPEQYQGIGTVQTDVFGIGALLYYMLTGRNLPQRYQQSFSILKYCSPFLTKVILTSIAPKPAHRYQSAAELGRELEAYDIHRKGPKPRQHLSKKIIITGSQNHIGATHIAASLVCWLNRRNKTESIYFPREEGRFLEELVQWQEGAVWDHGICCYRNFRGQYHKSGTDPAMPHIAVEDYGNHLDEAAGELADLMILVLGGRPWEYTASMEAYRKLEDEEHLILLCNYGSRESAAGYAKAFGRKVYCFPLEENPFSDSGQKRRLLEAILKEGGIV